jgi:phosphoribosylanthranilate isomerase
MVKVKICGITNWADAKKSVEEGADFLGFNFYRKSPRYVAPAAARKIIARLPKGVTAVGVFVNEPEDNLLAAAREAGLHQLQLHGDESPKIVARLQREFPVVKALRVKGRSVGLQAKRFANADALLLDAFDAEQFGGTGRTFDWNLVRNGARKRKLFLAGGLTPENIRDAMRIAKPYAVDVCSGVESRPGKKDSRKIEALMRAVRRKPAAAKRQTAKRKVRAAMGKKA